jgi:beta-phosphoglucomutase-like phosphatase (HAD superfamily)
MLGRYVQQLRYQILIVSEPEPGIEAVLEHLKAQPLQAGTNSPQRVGGHVKRRAARHRLSARVAAASVSALSAARSAARVSRQSASNSRTSSSACSTRPRPRPMTDLLQQLDYPVMAQGQAMSASRRLGHVPR